MEQGNRDQINEWSAQWKGTALISENINRRENNEIFSFFKEHLPRKGKILEAGCGLGGWVLYLRSLGYDVLGIDFAISGLQKAKDLDSSVPLLLGDVLNLPFNDNTIDTIISLGVIEHFEAGPSDALREAYRVLKPKGTLLVTVPHMNKIRSIPCLEKIKNCKFIRKMFGKSIEFWQHKFSTQQFKLFLTEAGFNVKSIHPLYQKEGFLCDFPFLRSKNDISEPTKVGQTFYHTLKKISPWMSNHMILAVTETEN